jgi:hypothetical protein
MKIREGRHLTLLQMRTGNGELRVIVDDVSHHDQGIPLVDGNQEHRGEVRVPAHTRLLTKAVE